jgi:hypothetical protein
MNISDTIAPKSDQLNADDLIAGPKTITITSVKVEAGDQPVSVFYQGDNGKPYKPCKSMRRVLVRLFGNDSSTYGGKRVTLYCDEQVTFGSAAVGGIRISHASGLTETVTMALTAKRGTRKPYTIQPLKERDYTPVLEAIRELSLSGTEAFRAGWKKLSAEEKAFIEPHIASLKQAAEAADKPE